MSSFNTGDRVYWIERDCVVDYTSMGTVLKVRPGYGPRVVEVAWDDDRTLGPCSYPPWELALVSPPDDVRLDRD